MAGRYLMAAKKDTVSAVWDWGSRKQSGRENVRLDRVCQCIQPVLNFASLLSDSIQGTGVARRVCPPRASEGVLVSEIVARGAADLRHGGQRMSRKREN